MASAAAKAVLALAALLLVALPGPCASQAQRHAASKTPAITASEQHRLNEQLQGAVNLGNVRQVRELLARGANADTRWQAGDFARSPVLLDAAALGNAPVVEALLENGARVNARGFSCTLGAPRGEGDYRDSTALIKACRVTAMRVSYASCCHTAQMSTHGTSQARLPSRHPSGWRSGARLDYYLIMGHARTL